MERHIHVILPVTPLSSSDEHIQTHSHTHTHTHTYMQGRVAAAGNAPGASAAFVLDVRRQAARTEMLRGAAVSHLLDQGGWKPRLPYFVFHELPALPFM